MILSYYGKKARVADCRVLLDAGRDGVDARALIAAARSFGLEATGLLVDAHGFASIPLPAIAHWRQNHFVVIERWSPTAVDVVDPGGGPARLPSSEFEKAFSGVVLALTPGPSFARAPVGAQRRWGHYLAQLVSFRRQITAVCLASIFLQLAGLVLPVTTAVVIDRLVPAFDESLLPVLGAGAFAVFVNQVIISSFRERLLVYLKARLDERFSRAFLHQLMSLPLSFFERRGHADLLSRLASNVTIRDLLGTQVLGATLDALFVLTYLGILFALSVPMAAAAFALALAQGVTLFRLAFRLNLQIQGEIARRAETQNYVLQAITGIATLKAAGAEEQALDGWARRFAREQEATVAANSIQAVMTTLTSAMRTVSPILLLLFGSYLFFSGSLELGRMLALVALATAFLTPLGSLVENVAQVKRAGAYMDRLVDVLNSEPERSGSIRRKHPLEAGAVDVGNVSFRYDADGPLVLQDVSFALQPGERVVLAGRSGSGKSTLLKLLLGLYPVTSGEIVYDGVPLQRYDLRTLRRHFGSVLQESTLFRGTIRENIALQRPSMPLEEVIAAARRAAIHDEIEAMPLKYETPVLDAGSGLSGGQRQRIALARALATNGAILILDEPTSHLDAIAEETIQRNLGNLRSTTIIVAHRLSTIRDASRIIVLDEGHIVEDGSHSDLIARDGAYAQLVRRQLEQPELTRA